MRSKFIKGFLVIAVFYSCSENRLEESGKVAQYLHLSHTRTNANPKLDLLVEKLDYTQFDLLWLGGDLAQLTSADDATMQHVDSIFDLSNKNTLWALGNHDYTDLKRVSEFTKKPRYYSQHQNGITTVVLDTQDSLSNIYREQKAFLFAILDTIQRSSHLVLLHHKLIWMYNHPELEKRAKAISNAEIGTCSYCINPNNFNEEVYPKLVELEKRGIEVICIGGDIGFNSKEFEYETKDGIYFLASGIHSDEPNNKALLFKHQLADRKLTWKFLPLENL